MCRMAGYVGSRRRAPLLLHMLERKGLVCCETKHVQLHVRDL